MTATVDRCIATAEVISGGPDVLASLAPEWDQLCDEGTWNQDPFCRPEWSLAYANAWEMKRDVLAATALVDGRLRAVLPLIRERGFLWGVPIRVLRQAGADITGRFDLTLTKNEAEANAALAALWSCLRDDPNWDLIEVAMVPKTAAFWQLMAVAEDDGYLTGFQRSFQTPIISLAGLPDIGEDPWLARASRDFRSKLRKRTRRLQQQGQLRLERFDRAAPEILERYYKLEQATWKGEIGRSVLSRDHWLRYYNEILPAAERSGCLTIFFLTLDERLIAGQLAITYRGKLFCLRCAFDVAFSAYGPGHIITNWMLRDCVARHIPELDFMGEAQEWKLCWTSQTVEHGTCFIFRPGPFGRALHALKFKAVPLGRRLFRRPLPD